MLDESFFFRSMWNHENTRTVTNITKCLTKSTFTRKKSGNNNIKSEKHKIKTISFCRVVLVYTMCIFVLKELVAMVIISGSSYLFCLFHFAWSSIWEIYKPIVILSFVPFHSIVFIFIFLSARWRKTINKNDRRHFWMSAMMV